MSITVLPATSEADLLAAVLDLARVLHWRCAHFRPALTKHGWRTPVAADGAGFPDLILSQTAPLIAAELKSNHGRLTTAQVMWLNVLEKAGCEVHTWRPADLPAIAKVLR